MAHLAFIVGVNTHGLQYCDRGAALLRDALELYGYEIITPGSRKGDLTTGFEALIDECKQTDTVILYFSGHATLEKGKLWFLLADDSSKISNRLDLNGLIEIFSDCAAVEKLAILDCCHAGQGYEDWRPDVSDRYFVLAASRRIEESFEFDELKASFMTYHLCKALTNPPSEVLDAENRLSVQRLHRWLENETKQHNRSENARQVPLPILVGQHTDFAIGAARSLGEPPAPGQTPEAQRHHSAELRYRQLLLETCDIVNLANLPEQDRNLVQRQLELRRLYVPLRVWVEAEVGEDADERQWESLEKRRAAGLRGAGAQDEWRSERQRAPVGERLAKARRLVVLGDPGAGKTTLTRWIATAYLLRLKRDKDWQELPDVKSLPDEDWLPILVRCRDLDQDSLTGALDDILDHTLRKAELTEPEAVDLRELLRMRLSEGRALLMLDGLDEITDPGVRALFCQQLEQIHLAYPDAPIIATSRIVGYREMCYRLGRGFEHVTLADLTSEEKDDFARRWCALTELPERRSAAAQELIHDIHSADRIERLTGNPMLLTTMALVKRKVGKLPSRRADLYWEAVQVLLNWRREVDEPMDTREAIPQLEYVAYAMCDRGVQQLRRDEVLALLEQMRADYPNVHLARSRPTEEFLSRLEARTAILVEAGHTRHLGMEVPVYEFRHLTFQEYLAARALVDGRFPGRDPDKSLAEHVARLAGRTEPASTEMGSAEISIVESWREPLRLCITTCQDSDVDSVLRAILRPLEGERPENARARAILAALCVADEPNVSETLVQEIFHAFAGQVVSERDGMGSVQTGADMAGREVAGTLWTATLRRALAEEFCRREGSIRGGPGGILAMVTALDVPQTGETLTAWLEEQVTVLRNGTEMEAIDSALGIAWLAFKGKAQIVPGLVTGLLDRLAESAPMADAAAWALAWLNKSGGMEDHWKPAEIEIALLTRFIQDPRSDPRGVRFISWIMEREKVEGAVEPLITWLEHADVKVRRAAVEALSRIGDERAVEPLMARLEDADADVRRAAVEALNRIGDERAVEPLMARLEHANADVRRVVANVLGRIGDERAVEPLITRLEDADADLRRAAVEALNNISSERAVEPLMARLEDADADVRSAAVQALSRIGDERAVEPLIARLEDADADVRSAAAFALGSIGDERAVEPLIARLEHTDADVRSAAASALGKIGSERAVEPLMARLEDADAGMRSATLGALAQRLEEAQCRMLSEDLDGVAPFLDPGRAITEEFANEAAKALEMPVEEIKAQYEALAARFKLRLAWQAKPTSTR